MLNCTVHRHSMPARSTPQSSSCAKTRTERTCAWAKVTLARCAIFTASQVVTSRHFCSAGHAQTCLCFACHALSVRDAVLLEAHTPVSMHHTYALVAHSPTRSNGAGAKPDPETILSLGPDPDPDARTQVYKAIRHGTSEVAVKHMDCLVDDPQKLHQAPYILCD